jgi:hypothetical protein
MLTTRALVAVLASQPGGDGAPILFAPITPKAAALMHGRAVTITFTPGLPAYTMGKGKRLVDCHRSPRKVPQEPQRKSGRRSARMSAITSQTPRTKTSRPRASRGPLTSHPLAVGARCAQIRF